MVFAWATVRWTVLLVENSIWSKFLDEAHGIRTLYLLKFIYALPSSKFDQTDAKYKLSTVEIQL